MKELSIDLDISSGIQIPVRTAIHSSISSSVRTAITSGVDLAIGQWITNVSWHTDEVIHLNKIKNEEY